MPKSNKIAMILLFIVFILLLTILGSRSSLLTIFIFILCISLAYNGVIRLKNRSFFITLAVIPLMIFSFLVATYLRDEGYDPKTTVTLSRIDNLKNFSFFDGENLSEDTFKLLAAPIFDRAGFLSYSTDVIANHDQYSLVINFEYYFKSIVDNVLTPGFDIFETPRASNSFNQIYIGRAIPTKKEVANDYNSEMFTIYGEYYTLFGGYLALIPLYFGSFLFKKIYYQVNTRNIFLYYLYRSLILIMFYGWINSFGFDWMLGETLSFLITIFILMPFYEMRSRLLVNNKPVVPNATS